MTSANILLVEDEAIAALEIQARLVQAGYAVVGICSTGEEAVKRAGEFKADLVLMDITLGGNLSGIEAARQFRSLHGIPVVFLTAHSDDATVEDAKQAEPYGYIPKPFDPRTLCTTIELALHRHKIDRDRKELVSSVILELTKKKA